MTSNVAFGSPGLEPRWSPGNKQGIGTAAGAASHIWFTLWQGILTEVYYPTVDRPQVRDLQYLISDGRTFFHEEKRDLRSTAERLSPHALGYRLTNADPERRYAIVKEVIADPRLPCVLQHTRLQGDRGTLARLRLYALCAPHLEIGGWGNTATVTTVAGRRVLMAEKAGTWLAMAATVPFARVSCGYVGRSDGWADLADNFQMDWTFDAAPDGNVALTGELDLQGRDEFTLGLAFGASRHNAITTLFEALGISFEEQRQRYVAQWDDVGSAVLPIEQVAGDCGHLYRTSYGVLLAHEDKTYPGAVVASLSIPWGDARGDQDRGGYHLVWTRDMVYATTGLIAAGHTDLPLRALVYLITSQQDDGGFPQNFWLDGAPYRTGSQLDEVAMPILLAWRLLREDALRNVDPYPMVLRAAGYLVRHGPATQQARWEEAGGYSPSTLATSIAALICAAGFARAHGDEPTARFLEEYADFLESHVESWTVTTQGTLLPEVTRHYIRILPAGSGDPHADEDPNQGILTLANQPPGARREYPAREIVDAGFLALVRLGLRRADDPLIVDSLRVVDATLKVETPVGPCWRRYNHDGYGQREDGGPFAEWGTGRPWPLLTGERGHYELAAGHDVRPFIRAMEGFASPTGLLPEQVWDGPDRPDAGLHPGRPTGSAMPLVWAHAEYIKLLRSTHDGQIFDCIPEVARRYRDSQEARRSLEVWKHNRQARTVRQGGALRIQAPAAFRLRWSRDEWQTVEETTATATSLGIAYVDLAIDPDQRAPVRFTFYWPEGDRWEGRDYLVSVV